MSTSYTWQTDYVDVGRILNLISKKQIDGSIDIFPCPESYSIAFYKFQFIFENVQPRVLELLPHLSLPSYFSSRQFLVPTGDRESQTITRRGELALFQNWDNGLTFACVREARRSRYIEERAVRRRSARGFATRTYTSPTDPSKIFHGTPRRRTLRCGGGGGGPGSMKYRTRRGSCVTDNSGFGGGIADAKSVLPESKNRY